MAFMDKRKRSQSRGEQQGSAVRKLICTRWWQAVQVLPAVQRGRGSQLTTTGHGHDPYLAFVAMGGVVRHGLGPRNTVRSTIISASAFVQSLTAAFRPQNCPSVYNSQKWSSTHVGY